jgi:hypothetical protein
VVDADTRDLLRDSIRALLQSRDGDLVAGLDELGWQEVVAEDPAGATDLLFTEQGLAGRQSAALDAVLIDIGGGDLRESVPPDGQLAVLHPFGTVESHRRADHLDIDGVLLTDPVRTAGVAVGVSDDHASVYLLDAERVASSTVPVRGFDPASSLFRITTSVSMAEVQECKTDWQAAVAVARRALAAELAGNGSAMLNIAVEQVGQRTQFGRPIGSNQTPRHRLAQSYVLLAGAQGLIGAAWDSHDSWDATVAKAYAGYASDDVGRTCLQVCGAIGLTAEHSLGGFVKRARILDGLYGGWRRSVDHIGSQLLSRGAIPTGPRI